MKYPHYDYAIIGGDMRQVYLAQELAHSQNRIGHYALCATPDERHCQNDAILIKTDSLSKLCDNSSCIICPIPFTKNKVFLNQCRYDENFSINTLLSNLKAGQSFFAGCIPKGFKDAAMQKGVHVFDFMDELSLAYYNSIATAEGAICEAIRHSSINLHHSSCAVLGYGKCGHTIAHCLKGMFCHVSVFSIKKEERSQAFTFVDNTGNLKDFETSAGKFDFIFNTIPSQILTSQQLIKMKPSVIIIDIASAPGGVDYEAAKKLEICAILCPGLPGKYAPSSSAKVIKSIIEKIQKE